MAVWLVRGGSQGEHETKFLADNKVYATWDGLKVDFTQFEKRTDLEKYMANFYTDSKQKTIKNWSSQLWQFYNNIEIGDLVILPLKYQRSIKIGYVQSEYNYDNNSPDPYFHSRSVKWIEEPFPRDSFDQDLLFSFGAFMTICNIKRNNAEERIRSMIVNLDSDKIVINDKNTEYEIIEDSEISETNIEELALDQITKMINAKFKGHSLTKLVDGILRAQGYTTFLSPKGPDGGVDILAGSNAFGFSSPKLCVEVKSEERPIDRPTVDKLIGAVTKFGAECGLFVSWSGYRNGVQKDLIESYFRVRLWSKQELLDALFENYDRLDEDLKSQLPLRKIWSLTLSD